MHETPPPDRRSEAHRLRTERLSRTVAGAILGGLVLIFCGAPPAGQRERDRRHDTGDG